MNVHKNLIPGIVADPYHHALLYGSMVGGLDLAVAKANMGVHAWNHVIFDNFMAKAQIRLDHKALMYDRFVLGIVP